MREKRWYSATLKQRKIVDADWASANQNMSDEDSLYTKTQYTMHNILIPTLHNRDKNDKTTSEQIIIDDVKGIKNSTRITYDIVVMHYSLINLKIT